MAVRHEHLAAVFANTADGVWISVPGGEIVFWNRAAESILGYTASEVMGQPCRDVFRGSDASGNRICASPCPVKLRLERGDLIQHFEMATETRSGRPVWLDVSFLTVPTELDDAAPATVHIFRDVTVAHEVEMIVRHHLATTRPAVSPVVAPAANGELTQRELEVVGLMQTGATTVALAEKLGISRATVRNHIQNIFSKLNVHTRLEAVAYVNGLAHQRKADPVPMSSFPGMAPLVMYHRAQVTAPEPPVPEVGTRRSAAERPSARRRS